MYWFIYLTRTFLPTTRFGSAFLSVVFTYKYVVTFPSISENVTSKKLINVWDHSVMNFMVGCFSFKCSIKSLSFSSSCSQRKKMPSMYLHHRCGFSSISLKMYSSNTAINNIINGGANIVPIAVLRFALEFFP